MGKEVRVQYYLWEFFLDVVVDMDRIPVMCGGRYVFLRIQRDDLCSLTTWAVMHPWRFDITATDAAGRKYKVRIDPFNLRALHATPLFGAFDEREMRRQVA